MDNVRPKINLPGTYYLKGNNFKPSLSNDGGLLGYTREEGVRRFTIFVLGLFTTDILSCTWWYLRVVVGVFEINVWLVFLLVAFVLLNTTENYLYKNHRILTEKNALRKTEKDQTRSYPSSSSSKSSDMIKTWISQNFRIFTCLQIETLSMRRRHQVTNFTRPDSFK